MEAGRLKKLNSALLHTTNKREGKWGLGGRGGIVRQA